MTFNDAWQARQRLGQATNWNAMEGGGLAPASRAQAQVYRAADDAIGEAAEAVSPEAAAMWSQGNRDYAAVADVARASREASSNAARNRQMSLTDYLGGGMFGAFTAPEGSGPGDYAAHIAGGVLLNRGIKRYEHRIQARRYETVAALANRAPQMLGGFGERLSSAAQRSGPVGMAAEHFRLSMTDPDYRGVLENLGSLFGEGEEQESY